MQSQNQFSLSAPHVKELYFALMADIKGTNLLLMKQKDKQMVNKSTAVLLYYRRSGNTPNIVSGKTSAHLVVLFNQTN